MQLSKIQLIWRSWRMAASRSVTSEMDILDTLKLLACLVKQFGGSINLTGSDLTKGQLTLLGD